MTNQGYDRDFEHMLQRADSERVLPGRGNCNCTVFEGMLKDLVRVGPYDGDDCCRHCSRAYHRGHSDACPFAAARRALGLD